MEDIVYRVADILKRNITELNHIDPVGMGCNLLESGMDSIRFIKCAAEIEEEFGIEFDDDDLNAYKFPTVQSLAAYVENRLGKA